MANFVGCGAALVVRRADGTVASEGGPVDDHAVRGRADDSSLGDVRHITEEATRAVGVDVEVVVRVPRERVPIGATVVVPTRVGRVGDARSGVARRIRAGQFKLNLRVGARGTQGSGHGQEVLIQNVDLALHQGRADESRATAVLDHMHHDWDRQGRGGVVGRVGRGRAVGAVGRSHDHGRKAPRIMGRGAAALAGCQDALGGGRDALALRRPSGGRCLGCEGRGSCQRDAGAQERSDSHGCWFSGEQRSWGCPWAGASSVGSSWVRSSNSGA